MRLIPQVRCSAYSAFLQFGEGERIRLGGDRMFSVLVQTFERDPEALVPVQLAHAVIEKMARHAGIPDFGYLVNKNAKISDLGWLGSALKNSVTLHEAIGKLGTLLEDYSSAEKIWSRIEGGIVSVFHEYTCKTVPGSRFAQQGALLLIRDMVRQAAGPSWQPMAVCSTDPAQESEMLERVFPDAKILRARRAGLVFDASLLPLPMNAGQLTAQGRTAHPEPLAAPAADLVESLRQVLGTTMRSGFGSLEESAEAIGMNPRTLQRRLAASGTGFQEIQSQVRYGLALELLPDPGLRIIDIAYELGYSDPANFTRAFRSWTGISAKNFRNKRHEIGTTVVK